VFAINGEENFLLGDMNMPLLECGLLLACFCLTIWLVLVELYGYLIRDSYCLGATTSPSHLSMTFLPVASGETTTVRRAQVVGGCQGFVVVLCAWRVHNAM
jgi:hypothetical protein